MIQKTGAQRQRKHRLISTSLPMSSALRVSAWSLGFLMGYNTYTCIIHTQTLRGKSWQKLSRFVSYAPVLHNPHCCSISRVWHCYRRLWTYLFRDNVFYSVHSGVTQLCYGEPARCLLWKNITRMCNKEAYIWYPNNCLARIIVYIWLNIDILCIKTVLDYCDFLVYMTNGPLLLVWCVL